MKSNNITISPATGHLLDALRSLESAHNSYYLAICEMGGEQMADQALAETRQPFDSARDVIEKEIADNIRTWAICTDPATAI